METTKGLINSLDMTSPKAMGISLSDNSCEHCKRPMIFEGDIEKCIYCRNKQENKALAKAADEQMKKAKLDKLFEQSSLINDRLKGAIFDNYHPDSNELKRAKAICERYANNFDSNNKVGLLVTGPYGTGKSHLAVSITKAVLQKGHSALFISVPKLMTKIQNSYNKQSATNEEDLLNGLFESELLVLDDLGAEKTKKDDGEFSWAKRKMFEIIDGRAGKHNVFTSNYDFNGLLELYGEREFSRMIENCHPVKMPGENYRLKGFKD
ncbi:ATP-binding protein [Pontibacillus salicampi]|uniref:ATP-binding protein n=1 Tax=Pontibacillus salicampi TaxID=1449801 RepID=A0ABV6LTR2_9BACI